MLHHTQYLAECDMGGDQWIALRTWSDSHPSTPSVDPASLIEGLSKILDDVWMLDHLQELTFLLKLLYKLSNAWVIGIKHIAAQGS